MAAPLLAHVLYVKNEIFHKLREIPSLPRGNMLDVIIFSEIWVIQLFLPH